MSQIPQDITRTWLYIFPSSAVFRQSFSHLVSVLLDVAGVCVALHDLELLHQSFFGQVLLKAQKNHHHIKIGNKMFPMHRSEAK